MAPGLTPCPAPLPAPGSQRFGREGVEMLFIAASWAWRVRELPRPSFITLLQRLDPQVAFPSCRYVCRGGHPASQVPELCGGARATPELALRSSGWHLPRGTGAWGAGEQGTAGGCGAPLAPGLLLPVCCQRCQGVGRARASAGGGLRSASPVTRDFSPALSPAPFPHLRGQRWLQSHGAVRGNDYHVERQRRGACTAPAPPGLFLGKRG